MEIRGIDVSSHQTTGIDFHRVKAAGIGFVIVRAGFGSKVSEAFRPQVEGALEAGLDAGVYWYSYAVKEAQAREEARACLAAVEPYRGKLTYPVWFDQEYEPGIMTLTNAERTGICRAFLETVQAAGWYTGLYTSYDWITRKLEEDKLRDFDLWVAQYNKKCQYPGPLGIWQYSGSGQVDGVPTLVDLDIAYQDYPRVIRNAGLNGYGKTKPDKPAGYIADWGEVGDILKNAGITEIKL